MDPSALVVGALHGPAGATLSRSREFLVCAVGKAARGMLAGFHSFAGAEVRGTVLATGPHPVPTEESVATARAAHDLARRVTEDSCLVILLSGGASAMMALPAPHLSLDDKIQINASMLARGVPIAGMNAVRKHVSAVKGGWLAAAAGRCCTLAISDVIGEAEDDPSVIGSGPGVPDPSTFRDAVRTLREFRLWETAPPRIREHLDRGMRGECGETPKPGDTRLAEAASFVVGSRRDAMRGAREEAARLGYQAVVIDEPVLGIARAVGPLVIDRALREAESRSPGQNGVCVISSGETTVHVRGGGRGGRNQELALAAVPALAASSRAIVLASVGTDGVDGPTDAAGAIVDRESLDRARRIGALPVHAALDANDSYRYFDSLGDLVRTGPTGTNVGDLQVVLIGA